MWEILTITGIVITEEGDPEKGVRFGMKVPRACSGLPMRKKPLHNLPLRLGELMCRCSLVYRVMGTPFAA
jgi:hypothetical protein